MSTTVKRSLSESPTEPEPSTPSKKPKNSKARIAADCKVIIVEHIIAKGLVAADITELSTLVGLSRQQIRSQLSANRQNLRKQLLDMVKEIT